MSKILRRPMFRGGPVDSYGTGIASGLADGGRVRLFNGGDLKTGSQIQNAADDKWKDYYMMGSGVAERFPGESDIYKSGVVDQELLPGSDEKGVGGGNWLKWLADQGPEGAQDLYGVVLEEQEQANKKKEEAAIRAEGFLPQSGPAPIKGILEIKNTPTIVDQKGDQGDKTEDPETLEISVEDQITKQAELFDKLFSKNMEAKNKERLKKARIQDISDVGLDIFARSTKPGADVKTMLGEAAERMVDKPSRTEVLQAKIDDQEDKRYQTSVALAVNDYIAGKRSKEQTDQLLAKMGISKENRKDLIDYEINKKKETITFNTRIEDAAKSFGKSKKNISVIQSAVDKTYGEGKFKGKLPEDQSELIEGAIYVGDSEDNTYKILYIIDEQGNPKVLRNLF